VNGAKTSNSLLESFERKFHILHWLKIKDGAKIKDGGNAGYLPKSLHYTSLLENYSQNVELKTSVSYNSRINV